MNEEKIREMQRQIVKLTESLAQMAGERRVPTFGEFAHKYQAEKMASSCLRESTKRAFEYQVRRNLVPAFGPIPLDKLGNADWNAWVVKMRSETGRHKQVTRFFNARKSATEILNAAKERGLIDRTPKLDNPDEHRNVGRVLSDQEFWLILRNTTYPIFRLFFYTMHKMGCRPREILRWEWSMIEWKADGRGWITVPSAITKTGRSRRIPLNSNVSKHLKRIYDRGVNSRFVFPNRIHPDRPQLSYHGAWLTARSKAGVKPCVPYDMRRSKITNAMIRGDQPVYIAKLLDTSVKIIEGTYCKDDAKTLEEIVS
jgi:integrase